MASLTKKKKFRHSTTFYRKLKTVENNFMGQNKNTIRRYFRETKFEDSSQNKTTTAQNEVYEHQENDSNFVNEDFLAVPSDDANEEQKEVEICSKLSLSEELRKWAIEDNISHSSVTRLLSILRARDLHVPQDSRTLLRTPKSVTITKMGNGQFWYNGLRNNILTVLHHIKSPCISLIFNVDGLPPFKSSVKEFWPILFKIKEKPQLEPMVVAIYCGDTKPPLQEYLSKFVEELGDLLQNGIALGNIKKEIKINYFVCDTPARSFIKGTVGFNSTYGCIKCTVTGEYDRGGRHMSFPRIDCALRTDTNFREKLYEEHHKEDSPLLKLPIDMVDQIIIADSLHLFHLGVMRKCLYGWVHGSYNFKTKFSGREIELISGRLQECNNTKPSEIHRAVRSLSSLKFWKGVEYRTFLLYLGPVILKDFLYSEAYTNFLTLHCAVTLLSCKYYLKYIHVAEQLLKDYIEEYIAIYGIDAISSNVHNLCHVINDVKKFGCLASISSYPFENFLGHLKGLLRTGNKPLEQLAKRVSEIENLNFNTTNNTVPTIMTSAPFLKNENKLEKHQLPTCTGIFKSLVIDPDFILSNDCKNKWFLTKTNDIVSMINGTHCLGKICIFGVALKQKQDFFDYPIKSSRINIYKSNGKESAPTLFFVSDIKCKLFMLKYNDSFVFIPILHTLDVNL